MRHLTLVGGTDVARDKQQNLQLSTQPIPNPAGPDAVEMEAAARSVIGMLRPSLDDSTVTELFAEVNRNFADNVPPSIAVPRNFDVSRMLRRIGIHVQSALPQHEVDVAVFGVVIEPKKLLKACPGLKPYVTVLEGLTL